MWIAMVTNVFFFFSSRRRHTRWNCDWSSDVCSSDLPDIAEAHLARHSARPTRSGRRDQRQGMRSRNDYVLPGEPLSVTARSEERRVGKGVDHGGRRIIKKKKEKRVTDEL